MEMTIEELAGMLGREFGRIYERFDHMDIRFDRVEKRLMHVEEVVEEHSGRFIAIEDRLSRIEYILDMADPRKLKTRIENLEKKTFGAIRPA